MAESSRDTKPTKPESEKKQPETVQLTAEELRTIAGGVGTGTLLPTTDAKLGKQPSGGKHG